MVPQVKIFQADEKGFTLIEVLVAMVIMSMVTIIIAMALRLSINAWERGVKEGETRQIETILPTIMKKQLKFLVKTGYFISSRRTTNLKFCGKENGFSFFSSYAPLGAASQGLLRLTYTFDEDKSVLYFYQQIITSSDDLKDQYLPLSDSWNKELKPVSQIQGVTGFKLSYTDSKKSPFSSNVEWKDEWKCESRDLPTSIKFEFKTERFGERPGKIWYIDLGVQGL